MGATVALMLMVTIGVYIGLSGYSRESLLRSQELAARGVGRLFADSCAAAVTFNDDAAIKSALATLGRNDEVTWAGVWAVDAQERIGPVIAALDRGAAEAPRPTVATGAQVERGSDRLLVQRGRHTDRRVTH